MVSKHLNYDQFVNVITRNDSQTFRPLAIMTVGRAKLIYSNHINSVTSTEGLHEMRLETGSSPPTVHVNNDLGMDSLLLVSSRCTLIGLFKKATAGYSAR